MDPKNMIKHRMTNSLHTLMLILSTVGIMTLTGWILGGPVGVKIALVFALAGLIFSPSWSSMAVMKMNRAVPLSPAAAPRLHHITRLLSERAGLKKVPVLYYTPASKPNAFAAGSRKDPAICVSQGLIRILNIHELAGIIGHEITHIKNKDVQVMRLAGILGRVTFYLSLAGQIGLIFILPLIWAGRVEIPLLPVILLAIAPSVSMLMQMALSRRREYEADLGSARLIGSPDYLISALSKLDFFQKQMLHWYRLPLAAPGQNDLLNTHPPTQKRIARLRSLRQGKPGAAAFRRSHPLLSANRGFSRSQLPGYFFNA